VKYQPANNQGTTLALHTWRTGLVLRLSTNTEAGSLCELWGPDSFCGGSVDEFNPAWNV